MGQYQESLAEEAQSSDSRDESADNQSEKTAIRQRIKNIPYRTKWQVAFAVIGTVIALALSWSEHWPVGEPLMKDSTEYIAVLAGIGTILAVVATVTFSFLLYVGQASTSDNLLLFDRYRANVKEVRDYFDTLYSAGLINGAYEPHLWQIEAVQQNTFPHTVIGEFINVLMRDITEVNRDNLEATGAYDRVAVGVANRLAQIWDTSQLLLVNWIGRVLIDRNRLPAQKSFATLAGLVLLLLTSVAYYKGFVATLLDALAVGAGIMTIMLLIEFSLVAARQFNRTEAEGPDIWAGPEKDSE